MKRATGRARATEREREGERGGCISVARTETETGRERERDTQSETESFTTFFAVTVPPYIRVFSSYPSYNTGFLEFRKKFSLPCLIVISGFGRNQFTCNIRVAEI